MELDPGSKKFPLAGLGLAAEREMRAKAFSFFHEVFRVDAPHVYPGT